MAEFVLKDMVEKRGLTGQFEIASAATSTEECYGGHGNPIYPPAQAELRRHGIGNTAYTDFRGKRARQVTREDYDYYDYLLLSLIHISEPTRRTPISYAVFCLKKKKYKSY